MKLILILGFVVPAVVCQLQYFPPLMNPTILMEGRQIGNIFESLQDAKLRIKLKPIYRQLDELRMKCVALEMKVDSVNMTLTEKCKNIDKEIAALKADTTGK